MNNEIPSEFEKVQAILNEKDINHLWLISCVCSLLEFYSGFPDKFPYVFPVINHSRSILFTKAVLYSKSVKKENSVITQKDIAPIFNYLTDCSSRMDFFEDDNLSDEVKMLRFFSSAACSQFWFLKGNIGIRIGLLLALYDYIPN